MSSYPHLEKLKVGCVQYLNAKPLIFGYSGEVSFDHPSHLARSLSFGKLDVALVPTFELLRAPHYQVVDGVSISAQGAVYSVFLAYRGDLKDITIVSLDTASLTSAHLLQCILSEYHGMHPSYIAQDECTDESAAQLLIGNQAIDFRREHGDEYEYLDLGEEWMKQTSLPFVFALWLVRQGVGDAPVAAAELRRLKEHGTACIAEVVRAENRYDADFETRYLTTHIRYGMGAAEKQAIAKFRELLLKNHLIPEDHTPLEFI